MHTPYLQLIGVSRSSLFDLGRTLDTFVSLKYGRKLRELRRQVSEYDASRL